MNEKELERAEEWLGRFRPYLRGGGTEVPSTLYQRVLDQIRNDPAMQPVQPRRWKPTLIAALLTLAALFGLYAARLETGQTHAPSLLACGALWGGLIVAALGLTLLPFRNRLLNWAGVSASGLSAFAVALAGTSSCPRLSVLHVWRSSGWIAQFGLDQAPGIVLMGALYAFIPAAIGVTLMGHPHPSTWKRHALAGAAVFFALLVPLIYLQCVPFSVGLFLSWGIGSMVGALGGTLGVMRLRLPRPAHRS